MWTKDFQRGLGKLGSAVVASGQRVKSRYRQFSTFRFNYVVKRDEGLR